MKLHEACSFLKNQITASPEKGDGKGSKAKITSNSKKKHVFCKDLGAKSVLFLGNK